MSTKSTRSLIDELNEISDSRSKTHVLENRVNHLVTSSQNIIKQLHELYSEDIAQDLERRLINSIKSGDHSKFARGLKKAVKESKE